MPTPLTASAGLRAVRSGADDPARRGAVRELCATVSVADTICEKDLSALLERSVVFSAFVHAAPVADTFRPKVDAGSVLGRGSSATVR